ncbi:MAG: glycosyltransferase family 1 protein [Candidatus Moraniibacteriota bacterium]
MKITIDARFINPENRGLSTYTRNLVFGLEAIDKNNEYYILLRDKDYANLQFENPNFKKILAETHWYGVKEQIVIPKILNKIKPDLTHFPHFNVPVIYHRPFITTIHDLILFAFPTKKATTLGSFKYAIKDRAYRLTIGHALKKAKSIIAVSKSTAQDILRFFTNVNKDRIVTIYEGAGGENDDKIRKYAKISSKTRQEWLKNKLRIKYPFIFYLGGAYPHKNLERLVFAFNGAQKNHRDKTSEEIYLVIAGGKDYFFKRLRELVIQSKIKNVIFPGFVSDRKTLEYLYQEALFCVFPSLYEGFGLPPLEALKRKKLVLCNHGTCFPEILGDAVIYFDGKSVTDISEKIINTLENSGSLKKEFLPRAQATLKKYSWEKMTRETLELYKKATTN